MSRQLCCESGASRGQTGRAGSGRAWSELYQGRGCWMVVPGGVPAVDQAVALMLHRQAWRLQWLADALQPQ